MILSILQQAMEEIHKLRTQISSIASTNFPGLDVGFNTKLKPPSDLQVCFVSSRIG